MNDRSDESVVRACQQGDKAAYAVLVERHYRSVFALCLGMLGNVHEAEDAAQEAMLRGLSKIHELGQGEKFEAWISRIARNICIDFLRRQKRAKTIAAEQLKETKPGTSENHDLQQAIRRLPQELRVPLTMFYFEQRNAKAIAQRLNISHSGACQKIRAARKMLHELLTERVKNE